MRVTVVVPAFNEERMIGPCLASLFNQSRIPDEIIVVDNDSRDQTVEIAKRFFDAVVITEPQRGITFARNAGFDAASGDIIARCDADSRLPYWWVKRIADALCGSEALAITGPARFYDVPLWMQSTVSRSHRMAYFGLSKKMLGHETLFGSNMAITKAAWNSVRTEVCMDESSVHEDIDLAIHVARHGQILFDPPLVVMASLRGAREPVPVLLDRLRRWRTTKTSHSATEQLSTSLDLRRECSLGRQYSS
jgi:glycosyltransferase involved in cell wall biosynthesis